MTRKLYLLLSIVILASMVFSACSPARVPTTVSPPAAPTQAPVVEATQPEVPLTGQSTEVPGQPTAPAKTSRLGGWLDKIIFSAIPDPEPAVAQIQAGSVDMYAVSNDDAKVYDKVKADPNQQSANIFGSSNQILFNTVTCTDKTLLNPFSSMKLREAMNWAVDRNYVVQEIFGGLAKAKYTAFTTVFPDYSRYADIFAGIEAKYAYNLEKAKAVVDDEMTKLGATKGADGKWQFSGKPVKVIGLIRTEDKRKEIGNYFANQLETLGFTVDRQEKVRTEAAPIWQGDPTTCSFNFYTAGWIAPQIYRDEGLNFSQYNTGELQQLPVFNAFQPSKELKDIGDKLYTNSFNTMDERRQLYQRGLELSMQESWWGVWVNDTGAFEPFNKKVQGAYDLAGGFALSQLFPYTVRLAGQEGGEVKIAQSGILVQPWNPVAGSNWVDDGMIQRSGIDYGVVFDPYTGLVLPKLVQKADVVALEGLPIAKPQSNWVTLNFQKEIQVPDDAWVDWDAANQKFITAAEKAKADPNWKNTTKTKTTVVYTPDLWKTTWHDGSPLSPADFVFYMIMTFDPGKKESKIYDESLGASVDTFLTHFKGVRITSTDPLTIETYDDQFALDAENNVKDWYPNSFGPNAFQGGMFAWHDLTPAILAEADGKMAFSEAKSTDKKIDYTSLISGPTLDVQNQYLEKAAADKYIPYAPTLSSYIKPDEVTARYNNLKAWFAAHKHLYIGTGPYFVDQVFPVEGTITVSRYDKYLFPADQFSSFGEPELMTLSVDGPTSVTTGADATFDISLNFRDQPYPAAAVEKVSYLLFNTNGEIVTTGDAEAVGEGQYKVTLSPDAVSKLESGTAKLTVTASSKVVSLPAIETVEFVVAK